MRICVFGLGYVGTVTAACLAAEGHHVTGVDVSADKVRTLNAGLSPLVEPGLDEMIRDAVADGRIRATSDVAEALAEADLAFVCVGTPSADNGSLEVAYVARVAEQIGEALQGRGGNLLVVLRSTVLPGTTREVFLERIRLAAGREPGDGYDVVFHPEFLREGTAVDDFYNPPKIVVGERAEGASERLLSLYETMEAPRFVTPLEIAETVKYADNAYHAVKVTFANEVGQLCETIGVDSRRVMEIFCSDRQLNISPAYLRPGFAFGGSCLPKDLRAFLHKARREDLQLALLESVLQSNRAQVQRVVDRVRRRRPRRVGMVGLAFKPGTDDLRESPLVTLAEQLLGKGCEITIWDPAVNTAQLSGRNRAYMEEHLPHLSRLMVSSLDELCACDVIVLGHALPEGGQVERWLEGGKAVMDLVGRNAPAEHPNYEGLYW